MDACPKRNPTTNNHDNCLMRFETNVQRFLQGGAGKKKKTHTGWRNPREKCPSWYGEIFWPTVIFFWPSRYLVIEWKISETSIGRPGTWSHDLQALPSWGKEVWKSDWCYEYSGLRFTHVWYIPGCMRCHQHKGFLKFHPRKLEEQTCFAWKWVCSQQKQR